MHRYEGGDSVTNICFIFMSSLQPYILVTNPARSVDHDGVIRSHGDPVLWSDANNSAGRSEETAEIW